MGVSHSKFVPKLYNARAAHVSLGCCSIQLSSGVVFVFRPKESRNPCFVVAIYLFFWQPRLLLSATGSQCASSSSSSSDFTHLGQLSMAPDWLTDWLTLQAEMQNLCSACALRYACMFLLVCCKRQCRRNKLSFMIWNQKRTLISHTSTE